MKKRLCKSSTDKKIAGVCGGIAVYLNMDPTIVRLLWAVATICWGAGLFAYILAAIIMPDDEIIQ